MVFLISASNWKKPYYIKLEWSVSIENSETMVSLFYFSPYLSQEVLQMDFPLGLLN